jgi:hypothetical protein
MVDLYTALKLCEKEEYIRLFGNDLTHEEIKNKYDLRKVKVKSIYFDFWHNIMVFETK